MNVRTIIATGLVAMGIAGSALAATDWATSEGSAYKKGDMNGSVGLSIFPFGAFGAFDMGVHDAISAGGMIGFNHWGYIDYSWNYLPIGVRGAFHPFNLKVIADKIKVRDKLDVYVGLVAGLRLEWSTYTGLYTSLGYKGTLVGPIFREYIGARWYFTPKFGVFVEDAADFGFPSAGVTLKF